MDVPASRTGRSKQCIVTAAWADRHTHSAWLSEFSQSVMSTGHPLFCFTLYGILTFYFSLENRKNCRSEKIMLSCRVAATYVSHFPQDSRVCPLGSMVFLSWLFLWTLWRERLRFCCSEGEVGSAPGLECKAAVWTTRNLQCYNPGWRVADYPVDWRDYLHIRVSVQVPTLLMTELPGNV